MIPSVIINPAALLISLFVGHILAAKTVYFLDKKIEQEPPERKYLWVYRSVGGIER